MWIDLQNSFTFTPLAFLRTLMLSANFFVEKFLSFIFFSLNIVNNTVCFLIVCPQWTDASVFSFITSPPLLQKQSAHGYKSIETKRFHQRDAENDPSVEGTGNKRPHHNQVTGPLPGNARLHEFPRYLSALQFL